MENCLFLILDSELYDLGDVIGLDPDIEEDRNALEDICFYEKIRYR